PQRRRLQPSPPSRLAEDHFARHRTRTTPDLHNSAQPSNRLVNGRLVGGTLWGPANASIQNGSCRLLISHGFLPKGDTTGCFRGTLRNKCFSRASDTTLAPAPGTAVSMPFVSISLIG